MPDLAEPVFWLRLAPTGCAHGSVRVDSVGLLPDDAHREFTPKVADRRREAAEGWRHVLAGHAEFDAAVPCLRGRCSHPAIARSTEQP